MEKMPWAIVLKGWQYVTFMLFVFKVFFFLTVVFTLTLLEKDKHKHFLEREENPVSIY